MSTAAEIPWTPQDSPADLHSLFATAPFALAQCQRAGNITALNPALEHMLGGRSRIARSLCFADLIHPQERAEAKRLLSELFDRRRDSFQMDSQTTGANSRPVRWTAWRVPGTNGNADYALASAEDAPGTVKPNSVRGRPRDWKPWAAWPEAWRTTSTIF